MSSDKGPAPGSIVWTDLTVQDATELRDFYGEVVGWKPSDVPMGDYNDFSMHAPSTGEAVAGVCHARGQNAGLPAQWLIYVTVENLDRRIARCRELGGEVIAGPKTMGASARYCVIRDPAGAVIALIEP